MFKVINVTAVPFHLARLQTNATKNIFQRTVEISTNQSSNNGVPILTSIQNLNVSTQKKTKSSTSSSTLNNRMMKKRNRILKNRLAAKASRDKWRLHKDLLEQQLQNLKEEKMRLLLENEELRLHHSHLEEEHISLKRRFEDHPEKRSVAEDAFEHASFVNVPLQKEWVLPHIFTLFLMTLGEIFNSLQLQQFLIFHSSKIYQILNSCLSSAMPLPSMKDQMFLFALSHKT